MTVVPIPEPTKELLIEHGYIEWDEADYFASRAPVGLYKYQAGEQKDLEDVVSYLNGKYVQQMSIRDPSVASSNTLRYLNGLVSSIKSVTQEIE